jgi:hypothetical protein
VKSTKLRKWLTISPHPCVKPLLMHSDEVIGRTIQFLRYGYVEETASSRSHLALLKKVLLKKDPRS